MKDEAAAEDNGGLASDADLSESGLADFVGAMRRMVEASACAAAALLAVGIQMQATQVQVTAFVERCRAIRQWAIYDIYFAPERSNS